MTLASARARQFARRGLRLYPPVGRTVIFPHPIEQLLDYGSVAAVLLDPSANIRNVYGVDRRGRTVWQLRKSPFNSSDRNDPYVELSKQGRSLRVSSFRGQVYDVDPRTGRILGSGWTR